MINNKIPHASEMHEAGVGIKKMCVCVCIVAIVTHLSTKHSDLIALQRKRRKEEGKSKTGFNH